MIKHIGIFLGVLLAGPVMMVTGGKITLGQDWRTADRSPTGIAPDPVKTPEAVVQVYAARAINWRGIFAVHTWIATKPQGADGYTVHQVVGWRKWRNLRVVTSAPDLPDRSWFGNAPVVIAELRGDAATHAIPRIEQAVRNYPYEWDYGLWPGPNSNTFTAHVGREVPELALDLPTTAIGKDFLTNGSMAESAPSGTGFQLSWYGMLGLIAARQEGLELNLLGLSFGIDVLRPAIKLPGVGRLGLSKPIPSQPSL